VSAACAGGVGPAGEAEGATDDVAEGGHDGGGVAGAGLAGVFVESDVSDPMHAVLKASSRLRRCVVVEFVGEAGVDASDASSRLAEACFEPVIVSRVA
jgi:hypothetical protein